MQKFFNVYHNLGYWFALLVVLIVPAFYSTYFNTLFAGHLPIIHIHFVLMTLWIAMLIAQPFLVKFKKVSVHRMLGKISYVLVPLVLISGFLMIRMSYYRYLQIGYSKAAEGLTQVSNAELLQNAADFQAIAVFYLVWFALFYSLAIINRRRSAVHARYMLAAALTLLGPIVDRIMLIPLGLESLPGGLSPMWVSFILIDLVLLFLLYKDYQHKRTLKTLLVCLLVYIPAQFVHFAILGNGWWKDFMIFVMLPKPGGQ